MPRTEVPVTETVLRWAVAESGFSESELAAQIDVPLASVNGWLNGSAKPGLTEFRKLAAKLHRPLAFFLLPSPPASGAAAVQFRSLSGEGRALTPVERRYLRRAKRLQQVLAWLASEMNAPLGLPSLRTVGDDPDVSGADLRRALNIGVAEQLSWPSASKAFDVWREAVEALGVAVFLYPMGKTACNGFSVWHERVPVIAINTAWREEARIFSLFHEIGHLLTRTSSACANGVGGRQFDPVERWCERVAAAVLLPDGDVRQALPPRLRQQPIDDLRVASLVASRFKVSLRAATIRLIHMGLAKWELYEEIPAVSDAKPKGGGGGGRNRQAIREDEVGGRGVRLFVEGVRRDLLSRSKAVDYLDIPDAAFDQFSPV